MTRALFPYLKLPGAFHGVVRKASLWEGEDHLLLVSGTRFTEQYRRFYYRDIEAIIVQRCARGGSAGVWVITASAVLIASLRIALGRGDYVSWTLAIACSVCTVYRLVASSRYSCRCLIQTAVSREELPMMRTWSAAKALARIRTKITEVQGTISDEIPDMVEEVESPAGASRSSSSAFGSQRRMRDSRAGAAFAAFGFILLLIDAATTLQFVNGPTPALGRTAVRVLNELLIFSEGGALAWSLVDIYSLRELRALRVLVLAGLCFVGMELVAAQFIGQAYTIRKGTVTITMPMWSVWHWWSVIDSSLAIMLGVAGLGLIAVNWQTYLRGEKSST